ncbi:DUF3427 domain-containing protein [Deinococcus yunweiensis]|uniref:DUF3427 domain-containing protein n=1 Tax=Deinococcus yunweiensis TaxID=367282 RepID=UPI00398F5BB6
MEDADEWERAARHDPRVWALLSAAERDYQQGTVDAYALLWAMVAFPDNPQQGASAFLERYPEWRGKGGKKGSGAPGTLPAKVAGGPLAPLLEGGRFLPEFRAQLNADPRVLTEFEARLEVVLRSDYARRHQGTLRQPQDLVRYQSYSRAEIANHLGVAYSSGAHTRGVFNVGAHYALIANLDTSGGQKAYRYENRFGDSMDRFFWMSQNAMTPDNARGRVITRHVEKGHHLHLFVQPKRRTLPVYLGEVTVGTVQGSAPFVAELVLGEVLPEAVREALGVG